MQPFPNVSRRSHSGGRGAEPESLQEDATYVRTQNTIKLKVLGFYMEFISLVSFTFWYLSNQITPFSCSPGNKDQRKPEVLSFVCLITNNCIEDVNKHTETKQWKFRVTSTFDPFDL